jgi:hypothetical protein
MNKISGLVAAERGWRAVYAWVDRDAPRGVLVEKWPLMGWAALGAEVWPVRVEAGSGVGVFAGHATDPHREHLIAVVGPGEDWEQLDSSDQRIRALILADLQAYEDDEDEPINEETP